jgi:hypothetical protein
MHGIHSAREEEEEEEEEEEKEEGGGGRGVLTIRSSRTPKGKA